MRSSALRWPPVLLAAGMILATSGCATVPPDDGAGSARPGLRCQLPASTETIPVADPNPDEQELRFDLPDRPELWAAAPAHGWTATAHLHVHSFLFDRVPGDRMWTEPFNRNDVGGAVAPSSNDVQAYRSMAQELGLQAAWITNGLVTGHYPVATFGELESAQ